MSAFHTLVKGDSAKPPVICLHGLLGSARNLFRLVDAIAGAGFYALAYDQRGHGHGARSDDYSLTALAEDVSAFMDSKNITSAHLVGHSLGARVALAATSLFPHRVFSLTMLDSGIGIRPEHLKALRDIIDPLPPSFPNKAAAEAALAQHGVIFRQFLLSNLRAQPEAPYTLNWVFDLAGIRKELLAAIQTDQTAAFKAVRCPLLIARGERSESLLQLDLDEMLNLNSNARTATIANAGHWVHVDNFAGTAELVTEFLKSVRQS